MLRRLVLVSFLFATLLLGLGRSEPAAAYSCSTCAAYATHTVNLRTSANASSSILAVIPAGSHLFWYPSYGISANGYVRMLYGSTIGYAFADYFILYPLDGTTTAALNLRSGAGLGFSVLLVMPSGAAVTVIGGPVNGFQRLDYNGTIGWASKTYLSFVDPNVSWYPGETPHTLANLRLRSGPGTSFSTLAILPAGMFVTIISGPTFANALSWYRVITASYGAGYVAGQYLGY